MKARAFSLLPFSLAMVACGDLGPGASWNASEGAEIRWQVKSILAELDPECPLTEQSKLLQKYAPLKTRYDKMKGSVKGSDAAWDIAIAEADVTFSRSQYVLECGAADVPGGFHETMASYLDERLAGLSAQLDALENLLEEA